MMTVSFQNPWKEEGVPPVVVGIATIDDDVNGSTLDIDLRRMREGEK
jgi:hypothetical protein